VPDTLTVQAKAILIDHLIESAAVFLTRGWDAFNYGRLLRRLDCSDATLSAAAPHWARRSRLANQLVKRFKTIAPVLGAPTVRAVMFLSGVPWPLIWSRAPSAGKEISRVDDATKY
jgi:hypothetical protein